MVVSVSDSSELSLGQPTVEELVVDGLVVELLDRLDELEVVELVDDGEDVLDC